MPRLLFFLLSFVSLVAGPVARAQVQTLPEAPPAAAFGVSVAFSEEAAERALVGASGEDVCGDNSGAAYVYERDAAGTWERTARLVPSDCEAGAFFGRSLALSEGRALVGASKTFFADERPNVAYVFARDSATGQWHETARLTVDPARTRGTFAASVALDGGTRAVVTSRGSLPPGARRPPEHAASARHASHTASPQATGGAAFVFERDPRSGRWHQTARLTPRTLDADRAFGATAAFDAGRLAVTASPYFGGDTGTVYVFERREGGDAPARWVQAARLDGFEDFSLSVALDGDWLLVGESRAGSDRQGAATVFQRSADGTWQREGRLRPRTPYRDGAFGTIVSISAPDGTQPGRALVTGYDEQLGLGFNIDRVVYVFERRADRWRQQRILDVGDVSFGTAIDHVGTRAIVGHTRPGPAADAAYVIGL